MDQITLTPADQPNEAIYLYLDIETIPTRDPAVMAEIIAKHATEPLDESTIKPAANLTDPAKISADLEKRLEKARNDQVALVAKAAKDTDEEYRKTALDGSTGHIACISSTFGDDSIYSTKNDACDHFRNLTVTFLTTPDRKVGDPHAVAPSHSFVLDEERKMLQRFMSAIEDEVAFHSKMRWEKLAVKYGGMAGNFYDAASDIVPLPPVVVAHHAQFDVRYIWQRCIILGVPVPKWWPIDAKPWDQNRLQDTMIMWAGATGRIGLDRLCRTLGIAGKGDIDGSKVWDAILDGRIDEVEEYCCDDVRRLRAVHRRMLGLPQIDCPPGYPAAIEEAA